jgi:hypothetical protein
VDPSASFQTSPRDKRGLKPAATTLGDHDEAERDMKTRPNVAMTGATSSIAPALAAELCEDQKFGRIIFLDSEFPDIESTRIDFKPVDLADPADRGDRHPGSLRIHGGAEPSATTRPRARDRGYHEPAQRLRPKENK